MNIDALDALERLREGNHRFAAGASTFGAAGDARPRHAEPHTGQQPFAIILGCSDSRVPAEIIFDQGIGDLFVIRVAGNIAAPSQIGSVEFAATSFDTRLVIVLGHSDCGAVRATLAEIRSPSIDRSHNLQTIVDFVRPSIDKLLIGRDEFDAGMFEKEAIRANIRESADRLRHGSRVLEALIIAGRLLVIGAEYSLETGLVDFFDGLPTS